ncbi:hypothetical protein HMPREF3175_00675 [Arthrobacter sp. HMSC08H08]|nr:hypothetical protein HMPREF3175_00675 [Arthrobacter sp. HMSC08H08]
MDVALLVDFKEAVFVPDKLGFRVSAQALVAGPPEVCVVDEAFARVQDVYGNDRFDAYQRAWLLLGCCASVSGLSCGAWLNSGMSVMDSVYRAGFRRDATGV